MVISHSAPTARPPRRGMISISLEDVDALLGVTQWFVVLASERIGEIEGGSAPLLAHAVALRIGIERAHELADDLLARREEAGLDELDEAVGAALAAWPRAGTGGRPEPISAFRALRSEDVDPD